MTIANVRDQLIRDEGLALKPYHDTGGAISIGYGRNLTAKGISRDEAFMMLDNDIWSVTNEVFDAFPWISTLSDPRRGVLLNMAYNLGLHGLMAFRKMLAALQAGNFAMAAEEMLDSAWATQVGDRAHRLAKQMAEDLWV